MTGRAQLTMSNLSAADPSASMEQIIDSGGGIAFGVGLNVLSGAGVLLLTKYIYEVDGFRYIITLSAMHFFFTWGLTRALASCKYFEPKPPNGGWSRLLPVALGSLVQVCFTNLSLVYNSIPFYQTGRFLSIAVGALVQRSLYGTALPREMRVAISTILLGALVATLTDSRLNVTGTMYAAGAVVATVGSQILTNKRQKELGLDHMQLLYHASPIMALGLACLAPVFDSMERLAAFASGEALQEGRRLLTAPKLFRILLSCVLALVVNISNDSFVSKNSPLPAPVVSHGKAALLLLVSLPLFGMSFRNMIGVALAFGGAVSVTELRRMRQQRRAAAASMAHQPGAFNGIPQAAAGSAPAPDPVSTTITTADPAAIPEP